MQTGDRVQFVDVDEPNSPQIVLGTAIKVTPLGYTLVTWDSYHSSEQSWFSPRSAATSLKVVTGDDAVPVHDWHETDYKTNDWHCRRCKTPQTDSNYWERCGR